MLLKTEQQKLYTLMPPDARCFVRVCDDDTALWVSDLPRRMPGCGVLKETLFQAGFAVQTDEQAMLWYVDWTAERWQEILAKLPQECPPLPQQEAQHELYALCRLWLLHPAPLAPEHMPALRRAVKLRADFPGKGQRDVRALHQEAARQLREGKTVAYAAGRVLAAWLQESRKETKP